MPFRSSVHDIPTKDVEESLIFGIVFFSIAGLAQDHKFFRSTPDPLSFNLSFHLEFRYNESHFQLSGILEVFGDVLRSDKLNQAIHCDYLKVYLVLRYVDGSIQELAPPRAP